MLCLINGKIKSDMMMEVSKLIHFHLFIDNEVKSVL